jgi:hypothetical protein
MDGPMGSGELQRGDTTAGIDKNRERQLVGSLTSAYAFKAGGLVKKVSHTLPSSHVLC